MLGVGALAARSPTFRGAPRALQAASASPGAAPGAARRRREGGGRSHASRWQPRDLDQRRRGAGRSAVSSPAPARSPLTVSHGGGSFFLKVGLAGSRVPPSKYTAALPARRIASLPLGGTALTWCLARVLADRAFEASPCPSLAQDRLVGPSGRGLRDSAALSSAAAPHEDVAVGRAAGVRVRAVRAGLLQRRAQAAAPRAPAAARRRARGRRGHGLGRLRVDGAVRWGALSRWSARSAWCGFVARRTRTALVGADGGSR